MRFCLILFVLFFSLASGAYANDGAFFLEPEARQQVKLDARKHSQLRKKGLNMAGVREVLSPSPRLHRRLYIPYPAGMTDYDSMKPGETAALRRGFANHLEQITAQQTNQIYFLHATALGKNTDIPPYARLSFGRFPYPSDLRSEIKSLTGIFSNKEIEQLVAFAAGKKKALDKSLVNKVTDKITSGPTLQFVLSYTVDNRIGDDAIGLTVFTLNGWTFGAGDHTTVMATIKKFFYWPRPTEIDSDLGCFLFMQSLPITELGVFKKLSTEADNWMKAFLLLNAAQ